MRPSSDLLREVVRKRDFYAGGLMMLLGLFIALKGTTYRLGTLMHMGPGFFPTSLGVILLLIGIAIAIAPTFVPSATALRATRASCPNIRNGGLGSAFS